MKNHRKILLAYSFMVFLLAGRPAQPAIAALAPGAPGAKATWTSGSKQGVGTSNTVASKIWFTLGEGVLNEVYYPTVDKANTRTLQLIVTDGHSFAEIEGRDTGHQVEVPDPASLVFRQVNTSKRKRYRITRTYVTDPERNTLLMEVRFQALQPGSMHLYVFYDPAINNSGLHDTGYTLDGALVAADGNIASALSSSLPFIRTSSGYLDSSDGWQELQHHFKLESTYQRAESGNVVQVAELPDAAVNGRPFTLALAFGSDAASASATARLSLRKGFPAALREYSRGWHDYIASLKTVDARFREQYQISAMVLKAHEDKTSRGAGAASLTIPWGDEIDASEPSVGGYHLVWARDLYEVSTAFLAMGDKASAERALSYLLNVQQKKDGSFPQNSWLDGKPYWGSLQMDEVSYPIILAWQLGRTDPQTYNQHLKPAANFIVNHGPSTPQERWEEMGGYSPSTIAAEIAGLVCAAEIARINGDTAATTLWMAAADDWARRVDSWTATTTGPLAERYFLRLSRNGKPDSGFLLEDHNGAGQWDERQIVDAGFLELVRLGIRPPRDPLIVKSLEVVDKIIQVQTPRGPAWYRYNHDGYGEKATGKGYNGAGIGRLWILFAGERGEYALAAKQDPAPYLQTMQRMANQGHMLAEQVWDRPASPDPAHLRFGEATGSATPLAWTNAQFVRLAVAMKEGKLPETPEVVARHFLDRPLAAAQSPRLSLTPVPAGMGIRAGQKIEIGGLAEGQNVAWLAGGQIRELKPGSFRLPVQAVEGELRISVAVADAGGSTAFEQVTIKAQKASTPGFASVAPGVPPPQSSNPEFLKQLRSGASPVMNGVWVTFVYRGEAKDVEVVGEFTDWDKRDLKLQPLAGTTVRYLSMQFPQDARLEYKFLLDGQFALDPLNPHIKDNGIGGQNNFFTMPQYHPTALALPRPAVPHGAIEDLEMAAAVGSKSRRVRVYLPPGYQGSQGRYPSIYFGDGIEYLERASAATIADNLIADRRMQPAVMIFVEPLDRMREYWMNSGYVNFLVKDLVPRIDQRYRTLDSPLARAIAGCSLGGLTAAYAALMRPDIFGRVLGQSSAFSVNAGQAISDMTSAPRKPITFYLETGRYEGLIDSNREARQVLESKGYALGYREVNAGHNWTHWTDALPDALSYILPPR